MTSRRLSCLIPPTTRLQLVLTARTSTLSSNSSPPSQITTRPAFRMASPLSTTLSAPVQRVDIYIKGGCSCLLSVERQWPATCVISPERRSAKTDTRVAKPANAPEEDLRENTCREAPDRSEDAGVFMICGFLLNGKDLAI